jgi:hypothetical protein
MHKADPGPDDDQDADDDRKDAVDGRRSLELLELCA